jgi:hypothetical protein
VFLKKVLVIFAISAFTHVVHGAAQQIDHQAIENLPYLQLILEPEIYLNDEHDFHGEKGDRQDLINYAQHLINTPVIQLLYQTLNALRQLPNPTIQDALNIMRENPLLAEENIHQTIQGALQYLRPGTIQDAIRWLTEDALKARLGRRQNGLILEILFSPFNANNIQTKIEETLVWLIRSEKQCIRLASYFFTSQRIAIALHEARNRGVKIEVIVDHDNNQHNGQIMLEALHIPYKIWHNAAHELRKMHNKFILFRRNIYNNSIAVSGSYNLSDLANDSHENVIITNDPYIFDQLNQRFGFINFNPHIVHEFAINQQELIYNCNQNVAQQRHAVQISRFAQLIWRALNAQRQMFEFVHAEPAEAEGVGEEEGGERAAEGAGERQRPRKRQRRQSDVSSLQASHQQHRLQVVREMNMPTTPASGETFLGIVSAS